MDEKQKHPWALALAEALDEWCSRNGYREKSVLAKELGISPSVWGGISSGQTVSKPEYYALIYWRTHLEEANPTKIPPRIRYIPRTGKKVEDPRAWTVNKLASWLKQRGQHNDYDDKMLSKPLTSTSVVPTSVGQMVDQMITTIAQEAVRQALSATRQEKITVSTEHDISTVALALNKLLESYLTGTSEERDRLVAEHGQALGKLFSSLNPLLLARVERERSIRMRKELGQ